MLTVHVWTFRGKNVAWGHAALSVGATYISWWPQPDGRVPSWLSRQIYSAQPFRNRTFADDVRDEEQDPDYEVRLDGLDESAIKDWWQVFGLSRDGVEFAGPLPAWHTTDQNCSTVVARALCAGGGDTYSEWLKSWNVIWTPSDVLDYAQSIERGLAKKKR